MPPQMAHYVYVMIKGEVSQLREVTKITKQKRVQDRYNIFLNDVYSFSVNENVLVTYNIKKGMQLSEEQIETIIHEESIQQAYSLAVRYLGYRMRSEKEIRTYLSDKEVGIDEIDQIVARLKKQKYLDDEKFAIAFVKDRMNQTSKGPQIIRRELHEKGINDALIENALQLYDYEQAFKVALNWATKQMRRRTRHAYRRRIDRLKASLIQKGFYREVVDDVVAHIQTEPNEEEEKAALNHHGDKLYRRHQRKYDGYELHERIKAGLYRLGFQSQMINEYIAKINEKM